MKDTKELSYDELHMMELCTLLKQLTGDREKCRKQKVNAEVGLKNLEHLMMHTKTQIERLERTGIKEFEVPEIEDKVDPPAQQAQIQQT